MTQTVSNLAFGQWIGARKRQEDASGSLLLHEGKWHVFVVADGMGGHAGGDLASRTAVDHFLASVRDGVSQDEVFERLKRAAFRANTAVWKLGADDPDLSGLGTTLLGVSIEGELLHWVSVGDSPLWLVRDGKLNRLNADHSMRSTLDEQVEAGQLTQEQAAAHPLRNSLRSVIGDEEVDEIDCPWNPILLRQGDRVLAASDGIETLNHAEIIHALAVSQTPQDAINTLLQRIKSREAPRQDNVTMALFDVSADAPIKKDKPEIADWNSRLIVGLLIFAGALLSVLAVAAFWPMEANDDDAELLSTETPGQDRVADEALRQGSATNLPLEGEQRPELQLELEGATEAEASPPESAPPKTAAQADMRARPSRERKDRAPTNNVRTSELPASPAARSPEASDQNPGSPIDADDETTPAEEQGPSSQPENLLPQALRDDPAPEPPEQSEEADEPTDKTDGNGLNPGDKSDPPPPLSQQKAEPPRGKA